VISLKTEVKFLTVEKAAKKLWSFGEDIFSDIYVENSLNMTI